MLGHRSWGAPLVALCLFACGADPAQGPADGGSVGDGDSEPTGDAGEALPMLPWHTGNNWTYRVTDNGEVTTKVVTIGAEEAVGGTGPNKDKRANKVTTKKGQSDETVSYQALDGDRVVRYRELSYGAKTGALKLEEYWQPHKLHIDGSVEHRVAGAEWDEIYKETKLPDDGTQSTADAQDHWLVDGEQDVTVPAGTFHAIVYRKTGDTSLKTYWYVPGIGKVKETGGQTEELVSFQLTP
ncbi:MAG: hypothetical protein QM778_15440 [Myxococcales bacterium]